MPESLPNSGNLTLFYVKLPVNLAKLPSLHSLNMVECVGYGISYFQKSRSTLSQQYLNVIQNYQATCPSLSDVSFPNGSRWSFLGERPGWICQTGLKLLQSHPLREVQQATHHISTLISWSTPEFEKDLDRTWPEDTALWLRTAAS